MQPKFKPKAGQVDYTNIRYAPVVNCVLRYKDKILLVQRSNDLRTYPGYWSGISGFLDDHKSFNQKVAEELKEELGLSSRQITSITLGQIFHQEAPKYKKTWIVHPVLVEVKTDKVTLDWEAQNCVWIKPSELKKYNLLPGFDMVLERVLKLK